MWYFLTSVPVMPVVHISPGHFPDPRETEAVCEVQPHSRPTQCLLSGRGCRCNQILFLITSELNVNATSEQLWYKIFYFNFLIWILSWQKSSRTGSWMMMSKNSSSCWALLTWRYTHICYCVLWRIQQINAGQFPSLQTRQYVIPSEVWTLSLSLLLLPLWAALIL